MSGTRGRDPASLRTAFRGWLSDQLLGQEVEIVSLVPAEAGQSSETWMVDVVFGETDVQRIARWVLRIEAAGYQVYQEPAVERQYRVMETLARVSDAPVPRTLWFEPDATLLDAPFFVMERVDGRVPPDDYHSRGVLAEATPAARETMWLSAIEAMARVHRADPAAFAFLDRPDLGAAGTEQEVAAWDRYVEWARTPAHPLLTRARRWLDDNRPTEPVTALAWGDARLANVIFRDDACVAVLDWETVSLGGAESDLGWWLYFDQSIAEGAGILRLEGIGGRDATIAAWETFSGRKARDMDWHEVFASYRFAVIVERAIALTEATGAKHVLTSGDGNPGVRRLRELVGGA